MSNKHHQKWLLQMPVGFILIGLGVLLITYSGNKRPAEEWFAWGMGAVVVVIVGLGVLGNAYIHKVKSDLIRRERSKHQQGSDDDDI
ncbi:MAG TPA: hypothetical protein VGI82_08975 [Chitinophagaceae bacterium]